MAESETSTDSTKKVLKKISGKSLKVIFSPIIIGVIVMCFLVMFLFIILKEDTSDQLYKDNKDYYDNVIKDIDWKED